MIQYHVSNKFDVISGVRQENALSENYAKMRIDEEGMIFKNCYIIIEFQSRQEATELWLKHS